MKYKLSLIVALFCLVTLGVYAQNSALLKGSSIVKGSIGFSSSKQTLEVENLPVAEQFNALTSKIKTANLGVEYNFLVKSSVYIGVAGFISSHKLKIERYSREIRKSSELLEVGPNLGILLGNMEGKANTVLGYLNMSPRYLSLLNKYQGYSIVFGFGILTRIKEHLAIDLNCGIHMQTLTGGPFLHNFNNPYNNDKSTMIDINIGFTGLLSKK